MASSRHDPDYIVNGATLRKIGESGSLEYTLIADEIRHYPDDDTTRMDKPKLVYLQPTKPPVTMSAVHGVMGPKGERVDLSEQVEVRRAGSDQNPPLLVETPELTVLTSEEKAFTKSHVLITQGNSWVQGVGMQVDNKLQTYLLESRSAEKLKAIRPRKRNHRHEEDISPGLHERPPDRSCRCLRRPSARTARNRFCSKRTA
jgi:lipopolysaccharide export system protein LptC